MKKLLPYFPLLGLILGLLIVQINGHTQNGLLSDVLAPLESTKKEIICTKPEHFSDPEETAWCTKGLATNIKQNLHNWNWSCLVGKETYSCHFTENSDYRVRGGVLFKK